MSNYVQDDAEEHFLRALAEQYADSPDQFEVASILNDIHRDYLEGLRANVSDRMRHMLQGLTQQQQDILLIIVDYGTIEEAAKILCVPLRSAYRLLATARELAQKNLHGIGSVRGNNTSIPAGGGSRNRRDK